MTGHTKGKRICGRSLALLAGLFLVGASVMGSENAPGSGDGSGDEVLEYRWHLSGFKGLVARLFVPGTGKGTLTTGGDEAGKLVSELHISAPQANQRDYWLYGSEIDPENRRTVRAWSASHFRGKAREKESMLDGDVAVDLASSIFFLRKELPEAETRTQIWSSGRLYDVAVNPTGRNAQLIDGKPVRTRSYSLRGVGEPKWRGRLDLVLAEDDNATPLEITVFRDGVRVRLELVDLISDRR